MGIIRISRVMLFRTGKWVPFRGRGGGKFDCGGNVYVPAFDTTEILKAVSIMAKNHDILRQSLARPGSQYTDEQKREAAAHYVVVGNCVKVSEITGIPERTLSDWKRADWWPALLQETRLAKQDEMDGKIGQIIDAGLNKIQERIEHGDYVVDSKNGGLMVKPVAARDLSTVVGIVFDKQRILRNLPTSISQSSESSLLKKMAAEFEEISRAHRAKTIEGSCSPGNEEDDQAQIVTTPYS